MKVRVLGPLEVELGGRVEHLAARKTRTLLAMLALRVGQSVDVGQLVDALWPDDPPRTAAKTLQTYVLQLRKLLGEHAIETTPSAYCLQLDPSVIDAIEFERLADEARAHLESGDPAAASARFRTALALWRGDAYPELADVAVASGDLGRLADLHARTIEDAIDADLALGQHRVMIGRLEALTAEHPLRERLWGQLILALYRSGRQADALRAYQEARAILADELGIDPGPELQRLEHAVLIQDPDIGLGKGPLGPATADVPVTHYARNGDVHLAYQTFGDTGPTILLIPDWYSHVEAMWEHPEPVRLLLGLARFARVVVFDARGTGMSDPVDLHERPTLEQWADDARAVLDAAGASKVFVLGASTGSAAGLMLAAAHPDRVRGMVLYNSVPAYSMITPASMKVEALVERFRSRWGIGPALDDAAPSLADDPTLATWFGRYQRLSGSPGRIAARLEMVASIDVRAIAMSARVPALVLHRAGNRICPAAHAEELAEAMVDARFAALPGDDHLWFVGDFDALLSEVEAFVFSDHDDLPADRVLASLVVVEIAGEPEQTGAARFAPVLSRHVARFGGTIHEMHDGAVVCSFSGPSSAVSCAHAAFTAARQLGLEIRAGAHTGEIDRDVAVLNGPAPTVARKVAGLAEPGELLLTRPVVDLTAGSGISFVERGVETFDDVPGDWPLFSITP